jgi:hypothetical protein
MCHHTTIGKVLDLQTGHVSPQFHCVYDKLFYSCCGKVTNTVLDQVHWDSLLQLGSEHASHVDHTSPDPAKCWQTARVRQDLFGIFRHPGHETPPPLPVPEEDGPILPFEQPGNEGTSDSEGDGHDDSEGAPANEGAPALKNEGAPPAPT